MGSEEDFLALADNAFAKLEWVETEGPDPAASEFAEVATFLKNSDSGQREDLLKKLVTVLAEMFSKEKEKHENQETDEFLVTCPGSTEVFSVGYRGFWLISLLELEVEHVTVTLESFKVGGLGPFCFLGVWGDRDELIRLVKMGNKAFLTWLVLKPFSDEILLFRFSSHICRQQKPLDKICLNEVPQPSKILLSFSQRFAVGLKRTGSQLSECCRIAWSLSFPTSSSTLKIRPWSLSFGKSWPRI